MTDSTASLTYVRAQMLPQSAPPVREAGLFKWVRENLFSSWLNILLTGLSIYVLYLVVWAIFPWLYNAVWRAGSLTECREVLAVRGVPSEVGGACFAVIGDRWLQFIFGFYPPDMYWRPVLAFVLFFVALAPVLFASVPRRLLAFSAVYPFLAIWLIWGGAFWTPLLMMAGFVAGYLGFVAGSRLGGAILGVIGAVVLAMVWWMWVSPTVSNALNRMVGSGRIEQSSVELTALAEQLGPNLTAIEADLAAKDAEIAAVVVEKDAAVADVTAERQRRAEALAAAEAAEEPAPGFDEPLLAGKVAAAEALFDRLAQLRAEANVLAVARFQTQDQITETRTLLAAITALPDLETDLPIMQARARDLQAALPAHVADFATVDAAAAVANQEQAALRTVIEAETAAAAAAVGDQATLMSAAQALRDALPATVAEFATLEEAIAAATKDQAELRTALTAVTEAAAAEKTIGTTYAELGRVGLKPVDSSEIGGFLLAVIIGISGITLSLPLGILLALGRRSNLFIINKVSVGFIEIIRGVPLIVWLFTAQLLLNYFLPKGTNFDLMLRVIIMVTLFSSAYIAEVIRGGLAAVPKGQIEAADAMGLDYWQAMRLIVLPQALKISIPGIVNSFIGLFKDTTLVTFIGMYDPIGLVGTTRASTDWNGVYWELYIFIGLLFFLFCFSMGRYSLFLERKLRRENR